MFDCIEHKEFKIYNGDCIEVMRELQPESVDFSVFSPPFSAIYAYTNNLQDLGNSTEMDDEFKMHYAFFSKELSRLIKPGRLVATHIADTPRTKAMHGEISTNDISGDMIRIMEAAGFLFLRRFAIQKNPQAAAIRNKIQSLLFATLKTDQSKIWPAQADWILVFKKRGDNKVPIKQQLDSEDWIKLAAPCWTHIRETDTLNTRMAKSEDDEKHICPLNPIKGHSGKLPEQFTFWGRP